MALKEIQLGNDKIQKIGENAKAPNDLFREVNSLSKVGAEKSRIGNVKNLFRDHIVTLHSSFTRHTTLYMLLPWAEDGSLFDLWKKVKSVDASLEWLLHQVVGLVGGLHLLHSMGYRHGDLKPDNILVFTEKPPEPEGELDEDCGFLKSYQLDDGRFAIVKQSCLGDLVISDFDTANSGYFEWARWRISQAHSAHRVSAAPRYEPPQAHYNHPDDISDDIWSLGCVLLEFIIWKWHGMEGFQRFHDEAGSRRVDKFWKLVDDDPKLHPVVEEWMRDLDTSMSASLANDLANYLRKLLGVVRHNMLVVETFQSPDSRAGPYRSDSANLLDKFLSDEDLGGDWHHFDPGGISPNFPPLGRIRMRGDDYTRWQDLNHDVL